ncbi:hypothetical protein B0H11DRAFT_1917031 [Mycena galericulata]|nr:hypothetical protein B0H11DRAFT_1917031 [Mycena galericulata]
MSQFMSQYKRWKAHQLQRETMVLTQGQRRPNELRIRSSAHIAQVLPATSVFATRGASVAFNEHPIPPQVPAVFSSRVEIQHPEDAMITQTEYMPGPDRQVASSSRVQTQEIQIQEFPATVIMQQPTSGFISWDQTGSVMEESSARTRTCQVGIIGKNVLEHHK